MITFKDALIYINSFCSNLYFVQIGAMDGSSFDRLYNPINKFGWSGLLVEPIKEEFEKLQINYRGNQLVRFENSAIRGFNGSAEMYRVLVSEPETARGLSTFFPDKNNVHKYPASKVSKTVVNCITPTQLLSKHRIKKVHVLSIDAEGCDFEILVNWNFSSVKPNLLIYESFNLSNSEQQILTSLLHSLGYELFDLGFDQMAMRLPILN